MKGKPAVKNVLVLGREPERLSIEERRALLGRWIALQIYSPQTLPLRRIEAIGDSPADCIRQLRDRGLSPVDFEFNIWRTV
ncbi:MAG: hypothetical protein IT168_00610 [Bryobacterales bacterium]|nr:hypothetical protein [Bryobacterales bacterium]